MSMLVKFMESTRRIISDRTVSKLVEFLDLQLAKTAREISIDKIGIWSGFRKRPDESYRPFWIRWGKLPDSLARPNVEFPPEVNYFRAMAALGGKQPKLGILLGALESSRLPHSV